MDTDANCSEHLVVINDEEQYSVWPSGRGVPGGWHATGFKGTRQACLDHIAEIWNDLRPKSLRERMEGNER